MSLKRKILVVDDDPLAREMVASLLRGQDYSVQTAKNGEDAVERMKAEPDTDLIISDMNMPVLDGLGLLERKKTLGLEMPLIFLTVNEMVNTAISALKNGADDYIIKDEHIMDAITFSVNNTLEKAQLRKRNAELVRQLERRNKELERMALMDPLTGIQNRRYLNDVFNRECKNAVRDRSWLSVIIMDIDSFKKYNDTYGHAKGDECLVRVAESLSNSIYNPLDFIARFGGEEFMAVLPETDEEGAKMVGDRLVKSVSDMGIPHASSKYYDHVTISGGIGTIRPANVITLEQAVEISDPALYEAKKQGGNRAIHISTMGNRT